MRSDGLQWWCSAGGGTWTWTWRPYPGVWLFVAAIAAGYALRWQAAKRRASGLSPGLRPLSAVLGVLLLWLALDWPVGPLGAGYLEIAHMAQFILIVMLAPPLLLEGLPPDPGGASRCRGPVLRLLTRPLVALSLSAMLVVAGHTPAVVDGLMATQLGSLLLDLVWLAAGMLLWWPLLSPRREERLTPGPQALIYLFAAMLPDKAIGIWLLLWRWPVYRTYELAPPVGGLAARTDQGIGAGLMLGAGMLILFVAVAILVQKWSALDRPLEGSLSVSATPP